MVPRFRFVFHPNRFGKTLTDRQFRFTSRPTLLSFFLKYTTHYILYVRFTTLGLLFLSSYRFVTNLCLQPGDTNTTWSVSTKSLNHSPSGRPPLPKRFPGYRYYTMPEPRHSSLTICGALTSLFSSCRALISTKTPPGDDRKQVPGTSFLDNCSPCGEHPNYTEKFRLRAPPLLHLSLHRVQQMLTWGDTAQNGPNNQCTPFQAGNG